MSRIKCVQFLILIRDFSDKSYKFPKVDLTLCIKFWDRTWNFMCAKKSMCPMGERKKGTFCYREEFSKSFLRKLARCQSTIIGFLLHRKMIICADEAPSARRRSITESEIMNACELHAFRLNPFCGPQNASVEIWPRHPDFWRQLEIRIREGQISTRGWAPPTLGCRAARLWAWTGLCTGPRSMP